MAEPIDTQTPADTKSQPETVDQMGYEGQIAKETTLPATSNATDIQSMINDAVKEVTVDEKGKYVYPADMDPVLKAAVAATKSYRDNQSGFTKSQQSLKETEAENIALREQKAKAVQKPLELSKEEQMELDKLYSDDPTAWRHRVNALEQQAQDAVTEELTTATDEAKQKAGTDFELQRRYDYLDYVNKGRGDKPITTDNLNDDVPNRINKKLADGSVTFEEYMTEVVEYLDAGKAIATSGVEPTTDLNKVNGGATATRGAKEEQGMLDYSQQAF